MPEDSLDRVIEKLLELQNKSETLLQRLENVVTQLQGTGPGGQTP